MRTRWVGLGAALLWSAFSACDCGTTTPGQNKDGGTNGTIDANGVADGSGGLDLVGRDQVGLDLIGRDTAPAVDRPGWLPDDSGSIVAGDGSVVITEDGGSQWVCTPLVCLGNGPLHCADCIDNDQDGKIDWRDPECLGPCDNTETPGLDSDVGGTSGNSCGVDCYFDFGNGPGWDDCQWSHKCDPLSPEGISLPRCGYDADWTAANPDKCPAEQSATCYNTCKPVTPNGCDCFGCCTFPVLEGLGPSGTNIHVWIGNLDGDNNSTCTLAGLTNPALCPPCTPVGNCYNECGRCELCIGRTTLPEDCYQRDAGVPDAFVPQIDAAGRDIVGVDLTTPRDAARPDTAGRDAARPDAYVPPRCDPGVVPCGLPGDPECPVPFYCVTGCCIYFGG